MDFSPGHPAPVDTSTGWDLVVPVKSPTQAKSRLSEALTPDRRRELVTEMFTSTVRACLGAATTRTVTVVTPDPGMAGLARRLGARGLFDPPGTWTAPTDIDDDPHNRALAFALPRYVRRPVGVVTADLPMLDSRLLAEICRAAGAHRRSIVVDHLGEGTTMAFWTPARPGARDGEAGADAPVPRFGPRSATRFAAAGAVMLESPRSGEATDPWARARQDVDTPADLAACDRP